MTTTNTFPAAILFDHDGTLVDTEPVWAAAKVALTAEFGGTWTEQDTLDCLGLSMKFTLDRLRERGVNLPDEEINDLLVAKVHETLAQQPVEFLPGIERFLSEVREAQIPAAVVTNATTSVARRTANAAPEGTFSVIIGNDETTHPKPNPQPYLWRRNVWVLTRLSAWLLRIPLRACAVQPRRVCASLLCRASWRFRRSWAPCASSMRS